jgi:hypothetical protein
MLTTLADESVVMPLSLGSYEILLATKVGAAMKEPPGGRALPSKGPTA